MHNLNRRRFLRCSLSGGAAAAGALIAAPGLCDQEQQEKRAMHPKVGAFTKSFQDLPIGDVCRVFKEIGLDGLDLTVRPGGHIEPRDAPVHVPKAARAAREAGVEILFLTTAITDADRDAERVLSAAADIGLNRVKMGYYRYREFGTLKQKMDDVRRRIEKVARLAARYKVLPCIHVHSGPFIPSHGTQLYQLIRDFSPNEVGAYVDPLHMTLEGGRDGWRQGLDLLAPWVSLCAVKNFDWVPGKRDSHGQRRWRHRTVPIADGIAPLPEFVATLKRIGFRGPYSLHSEYKGSHSFRKLSTQECIRQTAADLRYFRTLL